MPPTCVTQAARSGLGGRFTALHRHAAIDIDEACGSGLDVVIKAPMYRCSPVDRVHLAGEVVDAQSWGHTPSHRPATVFTRRRGTSVTRNV